MNQDQPQSTNSFQYDFLFASIVQQVWKRRKLIVMFVVMTTFFAAGIILFVPNKYVAEVTILPELEKNKLMGFSGISDLAGLTGLNVGDAPVAKLYPMIIKSARILDEVIYKKYKTSSLSDSVSLVQFWNINNGTEDEKFENALKHLQAAMEIEFDSRLGTMRMKVEMEEPKLAADVANSITAELDLYTRIKRRTSVTAQREFIEQRLAEVTQTLRVAEDSIKNFREKNRRIIDSPQLIIEQGRLERALQINSTVFIELKKQIEIAKIEEIKNIPVINILDAARVPVQKSSPNRRSVVSIAFFLSLVVAVMAASLENWIVGLLKAFNGILANLGFFTSNKENKF
ncbi:MAG: hypothetical protein HY088_07115 [Ignavibacteriales bacterium]|nr:hypothetical protein [Ignavibacteriales bacterium]